MEISSKAQISKPIQRSADFPISVNVGTPSAAEQPNAVSKEQILKGIDSLNKFIQTTSTHLKFTFHEKLNEYYVQIVDDQTNEVIREVPSKKILDMVAKMHEMIGLLIDEKR
ncbi:flagellar protein FlaG [Brevibacillus sp. WF146]|jgi:flagellar protein FlaG|uniref:flagellar protein FlaG n=1 Tax=Brevibacillus sp. WF146 TaxID=319501 RepID=UPI0007ED405B|nr:flagellar protein FlaG [Brevibacillus sp. WF146]UYZ14005.1 flagellar protein FlaG [Brevibacillus sp. WF146]